MKKWNSLRAMNGWIGLLVFNAFTFLLFGLDKSLAKRGSRRIPERTLRVGLAIGLAGGVIGMLVFHHKTRKRSFLVGSIPAGLLGLALLTACVYWMVR